MTVYSNQYGADHSQFKGDAKTPADNTTGDGFRSFYENSMDGILITTPDGKLISANPAACKIFELPEDELCRIGRDGIVDQSDPRLAAFLEERARNGKARGEIWHIRKNGTRFPAEISSAVFRDQQGAERTILIIRDITERKAIEEQLKQLNQELESRVEEKTKALVKKEKKAQELERELIVQQLTHQKLMTGISIHAQEKERNELGKELHDNINQVLGTVKLYLDMMIKKIEVPEDLLELSHRYLGDAIEEIRVLSKSLVTPSFGNISLREALQELVDRMNICPGLNIEFTYNTELEIDKEIEVMLYRIVQEQINNIRKYSQASTASINIRSLPGECLSLAISDTGIGFDTTTKAHGIGLKNIRSRVEYYSGKVNLVSSPGKGCLLEVIIPLNKAV